MPALAAGRVDETEVASGCALGGTIASAKSAPSTPDTADSCAWPASSVRACSGDTEVQCTNRLLDDAERRWTTCVRKCVNCACGIVRMWFVIEAPEGAPLDSSVTVILRPWWQRSPARRGRVSRWCCETRGVLLPSRNSTLAGAGKFGMLDLCRYHL
ncbi:hypothetical protein L1887_54805 [Cichorium endivia]|nr:hypothetical protein L1887_54805 [Cichorium endivia]